MIGYESSNFDNGMCPANTYENAFITIPVQHFMVHLLHKLASVDCGPLSADA